MGAGHGYHLPFPHEFQEFPFCCFCLSHIGQFYHLGGKIARRIRGALYHYGFNPLSGSPRGRVTYSYGFPHPSQWISLSGQPGPTGRNMLVRKHSDYWTMHPGVAFSIISTPECSNARRIMVTFHSLFLAKISHWLRQTTTGFYQQEWQGRSWAG